MRMSHVLAAAAVAVVSSAAFAAGTTPTGGISTVIDELPTAELNFKTGEVTYGAPKDTASNVAPGPIFSAMTGSFAAFSAANYLGFDDYDSIVDAGVEPTVPLDSLRFIGGVTAANASLDFNFYLPGGTTPVAGFSGTLPAAGNFIWTITNLGITIPSDGELEILGSTSTVTGQWFLATAAPTLGTQSATVGSTAGGANAAFSHRFELSVPEPASLSAIALGLPFFIRRRKA